ncbi:laccase [Sarracenia purpurea var. burkii]
MSLFHHILHHLTFMSCQRRIKEVRLQREWWNHDVETIVNQANNLGLPPQPSDAHTINGKPGPLFPCSEKCKNSSTCYENI